MSLFSRRIPYDRKRMLDRAVQLEAGWRWRQSLVLYRQVLAAEPGCVEVHRKAAPLLARSRRCAESWESFQRAAQSADETSARQIYREAARALPDHLDACRTWARLVRARGEPDKALRFLQRASRRLARRRRRGEAILLLRDAREIEPWDSGIVIELCRLLRRDRQKAEALYLLDQVESRVDSLDLRRVRSLQWRIEPSLSHTWRWLVAANAARGLRSPTRASGRRPSIARG